MTMGGHESDDESSLPPKRATEEVLARRPIAKFGKRFNKPAVTITTSTPTPTNTIDEDQANQLKSLNANFLKSINDSITKNPIADLNPILQKYTEYYSKIMNSEIQVKKLDVPKVDVSKSEADESKPNPFSVFQSFSSKPSESNITGEVPSVFAPVSISVPTPATEVKPVTVDSESEEEDEKKEIKIQGPSFKLDKVPTSKDYTFKFGYAPPKDEDDSDDDIEIKGPSFKTDVKVQDSVFKLPKINGAKTNESNASTPASGFSFTAPKVNGDEKEKETPAAPASFSFTAPKTEEKPAFSFGSAKSEDKPVFSFGAPKDNNKPAFSFSGAKPDEKPQTNVFSFNPPATDKAEEGKPKVTSSSGAFSFSFNPSSDSKLTTTAAPASASAATTTTTPAFSFNPVSTTSTETSSKPAFSFGSSNDTNKATTNPFSIGPGASAFNTTSLTPASSFSFSAPKPQSTTTEAETNGEADETQKDEVKGNFAIVNLNEKVDVKTGEEEEEAVYTKRSKISKLKEDKSGYDTQGLGELKVLKNKSSGKSRILVRSDGGLNVILNVSINKDVKYEIIGNKKNILKVPVFTENGVDTYICQVKTNGDAEELLKSVQNCQ